MDQENSELRAALSALEHELARYKGAIKAISELVAGHPAPACFEPDPETVTGLVAHYIAGRG